MSLAQPEWYKKLSQELGPAPAAPPRQKKRTAKRKRPNAEPEELKQSEPAVSESESEEQSEEQSEESDSSYYSDSDVGDIEVQQLTREQLWSTHLLLTMSTRTTTVLALQTSTRDSATLWAETQPISKKICSKCKPTRL